MDCKAARERWHRRYDEGIDDPALDAHIADCEACRRYDAEMRIVMGGVEDLASAPLPTVAGSVGRSKRSSGWSGMLRIAAAIVLAVGGMWWVVRALDDAKVAPGRIATVVECGKGEFPETGPGSSDPRVGISLRGESAGKYLAMAKATTVANVQMYWLYPTVTATADE